MIKNIIDFLANTKMTLVSACFLAFSLILMLFDINITWNPAWITILISGTPIVYHAFYSLFICRCLSSPFLITTAMAASIAIGEFFAAAEIALIMAIGEILEDITVDKAQKGLGRLLSLTPTEGRKITVDGQEIKVSLNEIHQGDTLRILPGETIPADGVIISGTTSVNQAPLTGESIPVDKKPQDSVMAGTINCFGTIDICAETVRDTYLEKMIRLVKNAQDKKAPTQKIVDKWASILVPLALGIAALTYLFTGELIRAVTILVVFCPCALVLATPTSIMAAIGNATKKGILIKSGAALEEMGKVNMIVFDKTGTLTQGKIKVSDIFCTGMNEEQFLAITAGVEKLSEHSLGKAVVAAAKEKKLILPEAQEFSMQPGKGVCALINGKQVTVGNLNFIKELKISISPQFLEQILKMQKQGKAIVIVALRNQVIGFIALTDELRADVAATISRFKDARISTFILTGDNSESASYFAKQAGVTDVMANLLPAGKVAEIQKLQKQGWSVCMVGDGINDAPALKTANTSIAMGHIGSDIAIDTADIALTNDNFADIPYLISLAVTTVQTIKTNIAISLILNFLGILLTLTFQINPLLGSIYHNISSLLVISISLRLYEQDFK